VKNTDHSATKELAFFVGRDDTFKFRNQITRLEFVRLERIST
jgi:hypothetical protein